MSTGEITGEKRAWVRAGVALIALCALCLGPLQAVRAQRDAPTPGVAQSRVLVLHSYHQGFTWTDNISRAIHRMFSENAGTVELIFEFMDVKRLYTDAYLQELQDFYALKYAGRQIDVIIASDDHALQFLLGVGRDLFPGVPVVFCAVNGYDPAQHRQSERPMTGVVETIDIPASLEVALRLHPETERVAVITDRTLTGRALKASAATAFAPYEDQVTFLYLEHLTMDQLQAEVAALPPNTVVYAFIFSQDAYGRVFSHEYNLARLAEHCPYPIYSVWEFYLGHGIVGGMLTSGEAHGEVAAEMALRVLQGEHADDIPVVMDSPNRYMFDYAQLQRFEVALERLPQDSIVINDPPTFYEAYKGLIWGTVTVFTVQTSIILLLVENVIRRRQAEREIRELNTSLEQRIDERTAQLRAANEELETFTYSVSHDLRAPLRAMDGFSRILMEEHAAALPPEAQHYLNRVQENAQQMGQLISDLLALSRLGRQALHVQRVRPNDLVDQALAELQPYREGRAVEISVARLPSCYADPHLLKQVFVNLLSNALKFTQDRAPAHIEVGSQQQDGAPVYFVRDNGVGFDMRYADKLFGVFQRLHRSEEYEGTGVGLAIVQRILRRHGGRIWAEAAVDEGATLYFTLPLRRQPAASTQGDPHDEA